MFERDPKTAQIGREILPFEMGYLPEYFQKKAEVELHESPENIQNGIRLFRDMLESEYISCKLLLNSIAPIQML